MNAKHTMIKHHTTLRTEWDLSDHLEGHIAHKAQYTCTHDSSTSTPRHPLGVRTEWDLPCHLEGHVAHRAPRTYIGNSSTSAPGK